MFRKYLTPLLAILVWAATLTVPASAGLTTPWTSAQFASEFSLSTPWTSATASAKIGKSTPFTSTDMANASAFAGQTDNFPSGSGTETVPAGAKTVVIEIAGGGGGGGFAYQQFTGGGGGGGAYVRSSYSVTAGQTFNYSVGGMGFGGPFGSNATNGGTTTVSGSGIATMTAAGGTAGSSGGTSVYGSGGSGGGASGGNQANTNGNFGNSGGSGGAGGAAIHGNTTFLIGAGGAGGVSSGGGQNGQTGYVRFTFS